MNNRQKQEENKSSEKSNGKNGSNKEKNRSSEKDSLPTDKKNKSIYILGDCMVKHVGWKLKKFIEKDHNVYVRGFLGVKVKGMKDYVKPCICEKNTDYVILHVGTNELSHESPPERVAKSIFDVAKNTQSHSRIVSISGIVPRNANFNIKVMEINKELSKMCDKEKLLFLSHSNINRKTHLSKRKLHLNRNGYEKLGMNLVNFIRGNYT